MRIIRADLVDIPSIIFEIGNLVIVAVMIDSSTKESYIQHNEKTKERYGTCTNLTYLARGSLAPFFSAESPMSASNTNTIE